MCEILGYGVTSCAWRKRILLSRPAFENKSLQAVGIAVPSKANDRNLEILIELINLTKPERVICLGDLFHSHYNPEWEVFGEVVKNFRNISFELVLGNHDIMSNIQYARKGIVLHETLRVDPFIFTHHPMTEIELQCYNIAGHIHPGVNLTGKGTITNLAGFISVNVQPDSAFGCLPLAKIDRKKKINFVLLK